MSDNNSGTLRGVAWSELCPWLRIFRTFRLARSLRVLVLGGMGILLTLSGWWLLSSLFSIGTPFSIAAKFQEELDGGVISEALRQEFADHYVLSESASVSPEVEGTRWRITDQGRVYAVVKEDQGNTLHVSQVYPDTARWMKPHEGCPWLAIDEAVPDRPALPRVPTPARPARLAPAAWQAPDPFFGSWAHLSRPLWEVRRFNMTLPEVACSLLCGLWAVAVWAFFGGAITRIAAVELASDERVGWGAAIRYACAKWRSYFFAPLFPLIGVLLTAVLVALPVLVLVFLPKWLFGTNAGVLLAAPLWPLFLLAGFFMAVLLLGLVFGWPLMWATISTEGMDSFDGLQRCYAYVFGRPLHYLFYAIVAAVFGWAGWLLVQNIATAVIWLTNWAASWGCGGEQIDAIMAGGTGFGPWSSAGAWLILVCIGCVKLLAVGFIYGYFWTASTAIYFLMRRDVDAAEMDEVFLDQDASEQTYGLPPLTTDEAGAPAVTGDLPEAPAGETGGAEQGPDSEPRSEG